MVICKSCAHRCAIEYPDAMGRIMTREYCRRTKMPCTAAEECSEYRLGHKTIVRLDRREQDVYELIRRAEKKLKGR